ncbi:hypothetical protein BGZ74_000184 [Mortierella antarctica]|nr:hypothetical protein BGZ74_000184 [Mortierella antarctica]
MPPVRILSFEQVAAVLDRIDKETILTSQAQAFHAYSLQETQTPQRIGLETDLHKTLIMPSRINTLTSTVKIVSVPKTNSKDGLPGMTIVLDNITGEPKGLVNARLLTALRTAAGSALATRAVFTSKRGQDSQKLTLVVFGSGAQAKAHIQLLAHVLPQRIQEVVICNRSLPRARDLVEELGPQMPSISIKAYSTGTGEFYPEPESQGVDLSNEDRLRKIVQRADVICTCTNSHQALFPGEWVQPGAHLNMVGSYTPEMHEVDQTLIRRAFTIVDARRECEEEAGEFILARKEAGDDGVLVEIGQIFNKAGEFDKARFPAQIAQLPITQASVLSPSTSGAPEPLDTNSGSPSSTEPGQAKTLTPQRDVSIFKSVGIAAQDVAITALVLDVAEQMDVGAVVPF